MSQFIKYIRSTMLELKQVSWPTQNQATQYTVLVIAISAVVALYVGAFDFVFSKIVSFLIDLN